MPALTLIIMAAGIGSRFGGLKQVQPVGPGGELIVDYSVYDALRAGFERVVFVIRRQIEQDFRQRVGRTIEKQVDTAYAFQELSDLPAGFRPPPGREKPWGTGHAVLSCRRLVDGNFAAINADDLYGAGAFRVLAGHLRQAQDQPSSYDYCMVGYKLGNTISEHGSVARGVCQMDSQGMLVSVCERTRIEKWDDQIRYTEDGSCWFVLPADTLVSMNFWGFTPSFMAELETRFARFLVQNASNLLKAEYFLPEVVNALLQEGRARVKVLPTAEKWHGVTNPQDLPRLREAIDELIRQGVYPKRLWED